MERIEKLILILVSFLLIGAVVTIFTGWRDWYLPITLHAIFISGLYNFFLRRSVVLENIFQRLFLQYLFCTGIAAVLFFYGSYGWNKMILIVVIMGIMNGVGTFMNWKAT